jgi:type IV secretory pathway VirB10-like protein
MVILFKPNHTKIRRSQVKITVVALMIAALALAGCQGKPKTEAPTNQQAAATATAAQPDAAPAQAGKPEMPKDAAHATAKADPHAGMQTPAKIPAGVPTKSGKVLQMLDGGQYIYLEVQGDDGKKVWVAAMPMKVAKGDKVKYADAPALPNFPSKTLNRTFDALVLSSAVEVVK